MKPSSDPLSAALPLLAFMLSSSAVVLSAQSSNPAESTVQPASPVLIAKFEKSLDTKSAKVGDPVTAKTVRSIKMPDGTEIPKGSKLVAKVITVQSKKQGNGNSMLTFRFDEADVKGSAAVPIHGQVIAIGPSLAPKDGMGPYSVMSRSQNASTDTSNAGRGFGSTQGLDPSTGMDKSGAKDEDNIAPGSTLEGVALGVHKDADWTTALQGFKCDVRLDSDIVIKVQLK